MTVEDITEERILNKVLLLLTILEPLVINEENAIKATEAGVITQFVNILTRERIYTTLSMREFVVQANLLLKLTTRSLVSCMRLPNA